MNFLLKLSLPILLVSSCKNSHEQKMTGLYKPKEYKLVDSNSRPILPILTLKDNGTFLLKSEVNINGKWHAEDNGDLIGIEFKWRLNNKNSGTHGKIVGHDDEIIIIYNPQNFHLLPFKELSFVRVSKTTK